MFREAFRVATTPRQGPVHLNLPRDVLSETAEFPPFQSPLDYRVQSYPAGNEDEVIRASTLLKGADRPVIIAGGGIKNSHGHETVLSLAEDLNAPVVTSPGHGDAVPYGHFLNAGQMGPRGNPVATDLVKRADVILALGTRLGFNATFYTYDYLNERAKIIQVELDPTAIGRYFPVELGILADATTVAKQIREKLGCAEIRETVNAWLEAFRRKRVSYLEKREKEVPVSDIPIQPAQLYKELRKVLPKNVAVTLDAGTLCLQATDALNYWTPRSLFTPLDFGLVGFSYACGLGVKLAQPERPVVSMMGDGGFGMTLSELSTAVDNNIATVTIVLNNRCWGAEKAYQRDFFDCRYIGADVSSPPFDQVAELYGGIGYRVEKASEIGEAVNAALQCDKPVVVDVMVDPNALYSFRRDSFSHRT